MGGVRTHAEAFERDEMVCGTLEDQHTLAMQIFLPRQENLAVIDTFGRQ